ncbi:hypothetical protein PG991_000784 [Apiospora marii]|uniref:Uncharacterized protein n=1 Tax=Apiospora marii TaxID=335849 RepID=A0ABR1SSY8_9PEZI
MDQQSLNLTDSVARWEASIAREMLEMELEMELERELKVFESNARAGKRDLVKLFESEIEELDQHLQRYPEDKDADELRCMRTVIERKRQAVVADRK